MEEAGFPTLRVGLPKVGKYVTKRKLSDGTQKTYFYDRGTMVRKNVELTFDNESEKLKFEQKCDLLMSHLGCKSLKETLTKLVMDYKVEDRRPALFRPFLPFGPEDSAAIHRPTPTWPFPFQPSMPSLLMPDVATNIRQDWHWPLPVVTSGPIPNVATQPRSFPISGTVDTSTDSETAHLPNVQPGQEHYIGQCSQRIQPSGCIFETFVKLCLSVDHENYETRRSRSGAGDGLQESTHLTLVLIGLAALPAEGIHGQPPDDAGLSRLGDRSDRVRTIQRVQPIRDVVAKLPPREADPVWSDHQEPARTVCIGSKSRRGVDVPERQNGGRD